MVQRTNVAETSTAVLPSASLVDRLRESLSPRSTPGGFRLAATFAAVVCALCGVLGASAIAARSGSLDGAATAAQQLVDVQEVRTAVVEADSIAASSYLVGGQESAAQRALYEQRLADATRLLADVAQRAPTADLDELATASDTLVGFAGLVEQARANNRQGFPVGAAYQRQASDLVRSDFVPALDVVDGESRNRLNSSLSDASRNGIIAVVLLLVALVALVACSWLLLVRTRRLVNVPVAVGGALVVVALAWSAFTLVTTGSTVDDTVDTSLRATDALSRARASAFDARSAESLTLVLRGSGAAKEADWQLADAEVVAALNEACASAGDCLDEPWEAYQVEYAKVRELDREGSYEPAVELSTGGAATTFAAFADQASEAGELRAGQVGAGFDDARAPLGVLRWFVLAAGLVAAAAVLVGFGQRLREYR